MQMTCPHCGAAMMVPPEYAGRRVRCGQCKRELIAPEAAVEIPTQSPPTPTQPAVGQQTGGQPEAPMPMVDPGKMPVTRKKKVSSGLLLLLLGGLSMMILGCAAIAFGVYWFTSETVAVKKTRPFFPDRFDVISIANFKSLRKKIPTDFLDDEDDGPPGTKLKPDDVEYLFSSRGKDGRLSVYFLVDDMDLEDVVKAELGDSNRSDGIRIYKVGTRGNDFWAKIDDKIVAQASKEELLKDAIENYQEKKKSKLNEYRQQAFNGVKKMDVFMFGRGQAVEKAKSTAYGWSYKKGLQTKIIHVFRNKDDAEDALVDVQDELQENIDRLKEFGVPKATKDKSSSKGSKKTKARKSNVDSARKKQREMQADIMDRAAIKRKGNTLVITLSVTESEIEDYAELLEGMPEDAKKRNAFNQATRWIQF